MSLPSEENVAAIRKRLEKIEEIVRVDDVRARRAFILAEEDAGVGLKLDDVLRVMKSVMGEGQWLCSDLCVGREWLLNLVHTSVYGCVYACMCVLTYIRTYVRTLYTRLYLNRACFARYVCRNFCLPCVLHGMNVCACACAQLCIFE
jgi:hypothetical protein